ncbi:bifunctional methylenetetrahydrofolate dehydrogenase/methenyltetrahydrofolate cyclohydrolase FolD [Conexibacter sp. JD483]|uniref:bifunctional methylenetetrahydrofolate dehydrogenase/methenyltetrahydrofolate cyclohydrolase FolD n=1 Tax=unclassified Conexibacter TaxID=2627773 RepID=UPI00271CE812|nr:MULTISPECIES: bifunctional methylenetetrahydrofolate dehydrogenase/methenyltetrahydrofolate cyclohydrolase FolD [unclassified Conexibacter]MDO8185740.1 bifunctional methylenetetrahydrofolate dehydrogenase/methenyltetrahydrofolate cyclohydrolase FolD [Conexibacter sp. CPCC 205706]MDO8199117.1 bifunctional methylenetetrahydrofolate dehydrogenase/methenyltetrahydrofolate cyclohydrolase FolD [Conexibacter sp. CPCC 205762]MDR9370971.1 bifunctional methylenetetrahydrofolate dehydrogenase/methenylte
MAATLIDGRAVARKVRDEVAAQVAAFTAETGVTPGLATVLVGEDPASAVYVANKRRASVEAGIADLHRHLPADVSQDELVAQLQELNADPSVSGILLQLPVPKQLDENLLIGLISPDKDVDGLTAVSAGRLVQGEPGLRPCTPSGVIELLDHHEVPLEGAEVVVVGRSLLVGKPVAQLLLERNATVTICHSRTRDLPAVCRRADVLIAAVGVPKLVGADHVKPGATVIDVGINRTDEGLVGDVDFDAVKEVAGLLTPVPGGVGPMTIALLMRNTLIAARLQRGV